MGTGFSYVNKSDAYAKDLATVASDMMVLLKTFFGCHREFQVSKDLGTAQQGLESQHGDRQEKLTLPQEFDAQRVPEKTFLHPRSGCGLLFLSSLKIIFSLKEGPWCQYSNQT